jgi:hypothetical protein
VTRVTAALAILLVLVLPSCGEEMGRAPCDDSRFLDQSEELYAALTAAGNASEGSAPAGLLVDDLRSAAAALGARLDAAPPCSRELVAVAGRERDAVSDLERAADLLESGDGAGAQGPLDGALAALDAAERQLR